MITLEDIEKQINEGPYEANWESLKKYHAPAWYEDTKFGIFIHWGVFSVPAYANEWYSRNMYMKDSREYEHHIKTYGKHTEFGYKDFIPMFKAENFKPEEWVSLFKESGAQYVIPVAEHHDGFQMYDSELSKWNAANMGPKRNVLKELSDECNKNGLINGASSHRIEHWFFMAPGKDFDSDIKEPLQKGDLYWPSVKDVDLQDMFSKPYPSEEFLEDWLLRCCELVDKYNPKIVYFDWWIQHDAAKPYLQKFAAYYYNHAAKRGEEVIINYKHDAFAFGTAVIDIERGQLAQAKPYLWQTDTAVAKNSWCYTTENEYKTSSQIIQDLVDIVSKNGRLLLNVGPKADGTIPDEDQKILKEIGEWFKTNGESIYSTRPWKISAEGPTAIVEGHFADNDSKGYTSEDIRFVTKGNAIYVTCLNMEGKDSISIRSFCDNTGIEHPEFKQEFVGIIDDICQLGNKTTLSYSRDAKGLHIKTDKVTHNNPVVFKITVK